MIIELLFIVSCSRMGTRVTLLNVTPLTLFCFSEHVWTARHIYVEISPQHKISLICLSWVGISPPQSSTARNTMACSCCYPKWGVLVLDRHLEDYLGASKHSCVIRHHLCQSCRSKKLIGWVSNELLPLGMSPVGVSIVCLWALEFIHLVCFIQSHWKKKDLEVIEGLPVWM